jgi:hypothetical protein
MVAGMAEAGQSCDEPLQRRRRTPSSGRFGRDLTYGDQPLADGMMALMDRTPPRAAGRFLEHVAVCLGLFGTHSRLQEPQRGQRLASWMLIMPKKGQRLPYRGLTSPF